MNDIINKYLVLKYLKIFFNTTLIFFFLGIILNLFEEIEFFKNLNLSFTLPVILSLSYVPTLIIELLPFIVFLSSMFYFFHLKSSKELLSIKVFGYSNIKITLILSSFAFLIGLFFLLAVNPITSLLIKYYEIEKAQYSKDVDHLVSINRNGVWIKENDEFGYRIIGAKRLNNETLEDLSIFIFDNNNIIKKRINAKSALITKNPWQIENAYIYDFEVNNSFFFKNYEFTSEKIFEKISSLYKNLNTISFLDLMLNYDELNKKGYAKQLLMEKMNRFITLPFFLFLMVVLASIFTVGSLKNKQNFYYVLISIISCVVIYFFKDLSIALGQTEKISLILSVWMPIIIIFLFCLIGVIQINEK
jgi:lipopolysaccharide export system permease protein